MKKGKRTSQNVKVIPQQALTSMRKIRVLYVLEYYYPYIGGIEKLFKNLAETLAAKGFDITVITARFDPSLPKKECIKGVNIIRIPLPSRILFALCALPYVLIAARRCDLIHTSSYSSAIPAFFAGLMLRKKMIITFHEVWSNLWFKLPFLNLPKRLCFFLLEQVVLKLPFNRFVAVSEYTKEKLIKKGVTPGRVERIYNGIDYEALPHLPAHPKGSFTYTYFGRLGVSKGLDILLNASKTFVQNNEKAHCKIIIPKNPKALRKKILMLIKKLDLKNYITVKHNLSETELYRELCSSHCVVIPSYSEGFCFAALEACALNIPVISSDMGALKETVSNKYLKLKELSETQLLTALEKAKRNEWDESPLKRFHLSDTIAGYFDLYKRMIPTR